MTPSKDIPAGPWAVLLVCLLAGCGGGGGGTSTASTASAGSNTPAASGGTTAGGGTTSSGGTTSNGGGTTSSGSGSGSSGSSGSGGTGSGGTSGSGGSGSGGTGTPTSYSAPPAVCALPSGLAPDSSPTTQTVGSGTAASCTEAAFAAAVAQGGVIRFNCGTAPVTIPITSQKTLRTDVNTTIDGGGLVTLDGGGTTRLLYFYDGNWQNLTTTVTLQNLTLQNGHATGTAIDPAPLPCSQGYLPDGGGGAIWVRDGVLKVFNSLFRNNTGASPGPDVAGGAIYAEGSLGVTLVGTTFIGNKASNGGAVGGLFGDISAYNSLFSGNAATGSGANDINTSTCPVAGANGITGEVGSGGNGGAFYMDGAEAYSATVCGTTFTSNVGGSGAFGGSIFRTPDGSMQTFTIDRSSFNGNTAANGGAAYFHNSTVVIKASTFNGNSAGISGGAIFADNSIYAFTNDTFINNTTPGPGGALVLYGNQGTLTNLTFKGNTATGSSLGFGAAIAGNTTLTISNTLFDNNTTQNCSAGMSCIANGSSGADDLQWPSLHTAAGCSTSADSPCSAGGTAFSDPKLGTLASNGGPTQTVAPLPGSPAVGLGQACPATDQRGVARPASGCTAGAVEGTVAQ